MARRSRVIAIPSLGAINRNAGNVGQQLVRGLRDAIATGELKPGEQLPSTRILASSLGLARGTVTEAFDQLRAEGYLEARAGAGTRVTQALMDHFETLRSGADTRPLANKTCLPKSVTRYEAVGRALAPLPPIPFSMAVPADAVAPDDNWRRLGNRVRASKPAAPATYGDPKGVWELRAAIADYVRKARAVICKPEQVIVTSGTQQGLYLAGRVLLSRGDEAWAENPAYPGLTEVLEDFDILTHRISVDDEGIDVAKGITAAPRARAAFVTPSHQYPLGMPLNMSRRMSLLAWAQENNAWVVEDDYDSELRYAGHPFPSMQGLDPDRVVYLGTLSKVLFPSLRLGYAIVPGPLVEAFAGARSLMDRHSATFEQHVVAAFMREGYFEAHIRRIRSIYAERRAALVNSVKSELSPWASLQSSDQGMHLLIWLKDGIDDTKIAILAKNAGIAVRAISPMYAGNIRRSGLMLGFGGFNIEASANAVRRLRNVFESASHDPSNPKKVATASR